MLERKVLKMGFGKMGRFGNAIKKGSAENGVDRNVKTWVNTLSGISHTQKQSANGPLLI